MWLVESEVVMSSTGTVHKMALGDPLGRFARGYWVFGGLDDGVGRWW